jgi:L-fuconolactonase (EC 3.1.1.-)
VAEQTNVQCKLSGLLTEPGLEARVEEVVAVLLDAFGPERLIWGSDWPVLTLADDYAGWLARATAAIAPDQRGAIFGANARRVYALD